MMCVANMVGIADHCLASFALKSDIVAQMLPMESFGYQIAIIYDNKSLETTEKSSNFKAISVTC